jgi:hypothetical protein
VNLVNLRKLIAKKTGSAVIIAAIGTIIPAQTLFAADDPSSAAWQLDLVR